MSNIGIKWGLILGLMMIIIGIITNMFQMYDQNTAINVVGLILLSGALWMSVGEFKAGNEGFASFGEAFAVSMIVLSIATFLSSAFGYIQMTVIDPGMLDTIKDMQIIELEKQGLSDEQIDQALGFMTPEITMSIAFVFQLFFGTLVALAIAAVTKVNKPIEF